MQLIHIKLLHIHRFGSILSIPCFVLQLHEVADKEQINTCAKKAKEKKKQFSF